MQTPQKHIIAILFFSLISLFFLPTTTFALSPDNESVASFHENLGLNLTLGNHLCALQAFDLSGMVEDETQQLIDYSSVVFRVPETCVAVHSRLRAPIDQTVWLSLSLDEQSDWLTLYTLPYDAHPPTLDRRGRYFGCAMPENGFHTCRVSFEVKGIKYQVLVPMRVGVVRDYPLATVRPTRPVTSSNESVASTPTALAKPFTNNNTVPTFQYGRGISIPSLGFYSGITTFPLMNNTWQIAVEERMVGHLQGTAWIHDQSNIVLGGHSLHSDGANGIFAGLYNVNVGQEVILNDGGAQRRYVVTEIRLVHYQDVSVVYPNHGDRLTMLTCHIPSYNATTNNYDQRLVVIAHPVG